MKKAWLCFCLILSLSTTYADVVNRIVFEGLDRVEKEVVEECITIKPGCEYNEADIDATIKSIFAKDFFSDVKIRKEGNVLIIKCVEKQMIDHVTFEGNDAASDDALKNIINNRLSGGRLYSAYVVKDVVSDFQMMYRALGYCSAVVIPKIIRRAGNKVDIVFEINEGAKATIKKIIFIGNKNFSDDTLKDVISTKEEKVWRFWNYESHIYREDKVDVDIDAITAFYKNNGYPFFLITSASGEISSDKKSYYCTFMMEEGDKYAISDVFLKSEVVAVKAADFKKVISIHKGEIYNEAKINTNKNMLRKQISLKEHPFIDVVANTNFNKKNKTASIEYVIVERPKVFLERINIVGNTKTLDNVIRREFAIHEGDAFNAYKVQNAVERLRGRDYFDDVDISEENGSSDDKKTLLVSVKEKEKSALFHGGLNWNNGDGFGGMIGFTNNNFRGTGRNLSAEILWAQKCYGGKVDLYDPCFMNQNFGAGLTIGAHSYNRKKVDESISRAVFVSPYIRYAISDKVYHTVRYTLSENQRRWWSRKDNRSYAVVPDDQKDTVLMKDEYGKYTSGEIASTLAYGDTDNEFDPHAGYELSMTNAYAGVIGNVRYLKNEFGVRYYRPLTEKSIFVIDTSIGYIYEINNTRSINRFSLGGMDNMRGFSNDGIGPKDYKGNCIGGNKYWTTSIYAKIPLSTKEIGINGIVFLDVGSAWGVKKYSKKDIHDSSAMRASVGVAIQWTGCPFGAMSFSFGVPLKKKSFDERQTFNITGFM